MEVVDRAEKETVFNDLWQLDLQTHQVPEQITASPINVYADAYASREPALGYRLLSLFKCPIK